MNKYTVSISYPIEVMDIIAGDEEDAKEEALKLALMDFTEDNVEIDAYLVEENI